MTSLPDAVEALSAQLRADLAGVGDRITADQETLIAQWPTLGTAQRQRLLTQLQAQIGVLASAAQEIAHSSVAGVIAASYRLGAGGVALAVGRTPVLSGVDLDAMAVLSSDAYEDLLAATQYIRSTTKDLIRALAREHIADRLATGQAPAAASRALAAQLQGQGIAAITYKDGARHGLSDYSSMIIRTKSAEAHQLGGFAQARAVGIEYMELLDGPGCGLSSHTDPRKANGLILTVDEAARYPLSHPRCRRVSSPRPDVTSPHEAARATPLGPQFTAEDIAAAERQALDDSAAVRRARARVARRTPGGTIVTERGTSKAQRQHATRVAKRVTVSAGKP